MATDCPLENRSEPHAVSYPVLFLQTWLCITAEVAWGMGARVPLSLSLWSSSRQRICFCLRAVHETDPEILSSPKSYNPLRTNNIRMAY